MKSTLDSGESEQYVVKQQTRNNSFDKNNSFNRRQKFVLYVHITWPSVYDGVETRPAGPWPNIWPPTLVSNGLKPSSSTGIPNCVNFASYVRNRSLCACNSSIIHLHISDSWNFLHLHWTRWQVRQQLLGWR